MAKGRKSRLLPFEAEIIGLYKSGMSMRELAEKYKIVDLGIEKFLKRRGIPLRSHKDAMANCSRRGRVNREGTGPSRLLPIKDEVIGFYEAGHSLWETAVKFDISEPALKKFFGRHGIATRSRRETFALWRSMGKPIVGRKTTSPNPGPDKKIDHAAYKAKKAVAAKAYRDKLKDDVLSAYGTNCACCGESEREFMSIDHIDGGGVRHAKELLGRGISLYGWLRKSGYPDGFRVLCHNCNLVLGLYGYCPHQNPERTPG